MNLRYSSIALGVLALVCGGIYYSTQQENKLDKYSTQQENKFDKAAKIIALRQLGHELLLASGDSTSQVLPVIEISDSEYQLQFQNPFSFKPRSLVDITERNMKMNKVSDDYIVNVAEPANKGAVAYGFSVSDKKKNIPCFGRFIPVKKYNVNIMLRSSMVPLPDKGNNLTLIWIVVLIIGFSILKLKKVIPESVLPTELTDTKMIRIGKYLFYPGELLLIIDERKTILTYKESKLLNIFTTNINNIIDRSRLLKEGWEDEGVITQRSLDMYVSRLRKKLGNDPKVRITNIHGKGYCLKDTCM